MTLLVPEQRTLTFDPKKPTWHWVISDANGNALGEITDAQQRQVTWLLKDSCSASWQMDAMHPQAELVDELITDLLLYRNNVLMFRGRVGSTQDTLGTPNAGGGGSNPDTHTVQFSAVDYRAMLGYRVIPDPGWGFTSMDQADIAWSLINQTQALAGGNWNITRGTTTTSVARTLTEPAGTYVMQAINDISTMDQGFEWEIDPHLKFNMWPQPALGVLEQGRGQDIGQTLTYGDNVMGALRSLDATQYANVIRYAGSGTLISNFDIISLGLATSWPTQGRMESEDSNINLTDQISTDAAAKADLVNKSTMMPSYSLTLTHGWWDPTQIWLGDVVEVNVDHGRISESLDMRVSEIDLYLGDQGDEETMVLTCGRRQGSLLRRIPTNEKRLEQIAKRV